MNRRIQSPLGAACGIALLAGCFGTPAPADGVGTSSTAGTSGSDTSSSTTSESTGADLSSTSDATGPSGAVEFTDDELDGEFGAGAFGGTQWIGDRLAIEAEAADGVFQSRAFDSGSAQTSWERISWVPAAPYGVPLPNDGAVERGYESGGADMLDNVLLLHMEGRGSIGHGAQVEEHSGLEHLVAANVTGTIPAYVDGVLGTGFADTVGAYLLVAAGPGHALEPASDDFTWAVWFSGAVQCEGSSGSNNHAFIGMESNESADVRTHMWLGCYRSTDNDCEVGPALSRGGGTLQSSRSPDDAVNMCGDVPIIDGKWHHLALVKSGHPSATVSLYLDGELTLQRTSTFERPFVFYGPTEFRMGTLITDSIPSTLDEVAVWRRALAPDEIAGIFRRAALRLQFQVRSCTDPACADNPPFVGPDGVLDAHYSDPGGGAIDVSITPPLSGRYVQYRATFDATIAGTGAAGPHLLAVTVSGQRP